jgi:hypothetical protein
VGPQVKAISAIACSGMPLAPVVISGEAVLEFMRDSFVVVVPEAGFDLRGNAVPVAIYAGGKIDFGRSRAAKVAFTDGAGKWFNVAA